MNLSICLNFTPVQQVNSIEKKTTKKQEGLIKLLAQRVEKVRKTLCWCHPVGKHGWRTRCCDVCACHGQRDCLLDPSCVLASRWVENAGALRPPATWGDQDEPSVCLSWRSPSVNVTRSNDHCMFWRERGRAQHVAWRTREGICLFPNGQKPRSNSSSGQEC